MAFTVTTGANTGGTAAATVAVAVPGGSAAAGDLLLVLFESQTGSTGPNSTGWTMTTLGAITGLTGTSRISVGLRIADGSEGASQTFNLPATNNHASGQMAKVTGHGCSSVGDVVVGTIASGAAGSGAITGVPSITVTAGSLIILCATSAFDTDSTTHFSGYANTDPGSGAAWTEIFDTLVSTGNGGGIGAAYGVCAGTTTGTASVTQANTTDGWAALQIGIKPVVTNTFVQPHFRVRSDDSQGLNVDAGWAGALDANVTMDAEKIFRIRFEVENTSTAVNTGFKLQYSRNGGAWFNAVAAPVEDTVVESVEIPLSAQFADGAATTNILTGSGLTFVAGTGNEDNDTGAWNNGNAHTEFEWPIRIRKTYGTFTSLTFGHNLDGDTFQFRVVTLAGDAFSGTYVSPTITLNVPDGLLGGSYAETPMDVGPVRDGNGNLYVVQEYSVPAPSFAIMKSTDGGDQWAAMDGANRPSRRDLEAVDVVQSGTSIYMLHQQTNNVSFHSFRTSDDGTPDTWNLKNEDVIIPQPTAVLDQMCSLVRRSDGSFVACYASDPSGASGRCAFNTRSSGGTWSGTATDIDGQGSTSFMQAATVLGASDVTYLFYLDATNGILYMRTISAANALSARTSFATGLGTTTAFNHAIVKPAYYDSSGTEVIVVVYAKSDSKLYSRHIVGGTPATEQAVTSETVVNDATGTTSRAPAATLSVDGTDAYVVYADAATSDVWVRKSAAGGAWSAATEVVDNVTAQFAIGNIFTHSAGNGGQKVFGFTYDDGSNGETGHIKYAEYVLAAAAKTITALAATATATAPSVPDPAAQVRPYINVGLGVVP